MPYLGPDSRDGNLPPRFFWYSESLALRPGACELLQVVAKTDANLVGVQILDHRVAVDAGEVGVARLGIAQEEEAIADIEHQAAAGVRRRQARPSRWRSKPSSDRRSTER